MQQTETSRTTAVYLGWGRLASGGALLLSLTTGLVYGQVWFEVPLLVGGVTLAVLGGLARTGLGSDRLAGALGWLETITFAIVLAAGGEEDAGYAAVILLLMFVLAALRGPSAYRMALGFGLVAEAVRQVVSSAVDNGIDPASSLLALGLAAAIGGLVSGMVQREADIAQRFRELDRLKTDFVAITSHELRAPLTTIIGTLELLQRPEAAGDPDTRGKLIDAAERQAQRLKRLVTDLQTVSSVDAGTLHVRATPVDVARIVEEVAGALPDVAISIDVPDEAPTALADADRTAQVLTNLVMNGALHGQGTVHVLVRPLPHQVLVRVTDDGPGVPEEVRAHVFDRFVHHSSATSAKGMGLGLAIARELARAMGGGLDLVVTDTGTAFDLRLPAAP